MAIPRTVAFAALVAALLLPALPAYACDSNYPWLCKPIPSIEPSEPAETKPSKPLPITSQRRDTIKAAKARAAAVKSTKAKVVQRSAQTRVKQAARKAPARRLVLRARHHNLAAASPEDLAPTSSEATRITAARPVERTLRPATPSAGNTEPAGEANGGIAAAWERSTGLAEPIGTATVAATMAQASEPAGEPAPANPVPVASPNEVNEIDLVAADPPRSDGSWLRGLFLAFGGILALGSALRLFL
jgi:hypothetical protein